MRLQDKFTAYRARGASEDLFLELTGFPYPPSSKAWRQGQLEALLELNITSIWSSELALQLHDFQRSPGDELCWSFHPHSFDVAKTKGMSLEKMVKRHLNI